MLPGVLSRFGGVVGVSSAPSVCGIPQLTGEGGGEVLTGERITFRFLLEHDSIVGAVAAGFPATVGWGPATAAAAAARGFCCCCICWLLC